MRTRLLLAVLAILAAVTASAPARAGAVTEAQPQQLMHLDQALAAIAQPLQPVPVMLPDTGVDQMHDLAGRLWTSSVDQPGPQQFGNGASATIHAGSHGYDIVGSTDADNPGTPTDDPQDPAGHSGHGTAISGVLAGIAPNAQLVGSRTCWDDDDCYQSLVAPMIDWAAGPAPAPGVRVVTMSWLDGDTLEPELTQAFSSHPDTLFVAIPSGNGYDGDVDGSNPQPCSLAATEDNVLCVTTSSPTDGTDCGGYGSGTVDLAVPTENNVTTVNGGGTASTGCATSYAAPTAGGVAAILFGMKPSATAADVKRALLAGTRPVAAWQGRSRTGGVLDALLAVQAFQQQQGIPAATGTPPPPPAAPVVPAAPLVPAPKPGLTAGTRSLTVRHGHTAKLPLTLTVPEKVALVVTQRRHGHVVRVASVGAVRVDAGRHSLSLPLKKLAAGRYTVVAKLESSRGTTLLTRSVPLRIT